MYISPFQTFIILMLLIGLQRLVEMVYAEKNHWKILELGGIECGKRHFPWLILVHIGWFTSCVVEASLNSYWPSSTWIINGLGLITFCQLFRIWVKLSINNNWTNRRVILPAEIFKKSGPYKFFRHPDYIVLVLEVAIVPAIFGLWFSAIIFSIFNGAIIWSWIDVEDSLLVENQKEELDLAKSLY
ncbi:MAG: isoprenylcysteine carboxylmethyltransferase family protein [Bacteriovoracia bacterium]